MTLQTLGGEGPFPGQPGPGPRPRRWLLGCGLGLAILGTGVLVLLLSGDRWARWVLAWSLRTVESQVTAALPEELEPAQRQRLDAAFEAARERLAADRPLDGAALQRFQPVLMRVAQAAGRNELSVEDCRALTAALEVLAGREGEPVESGSEAGAGREPAAEGAPGPDPPGPQPGMPPGSSSASAPSGVREEPGPRSPRAASSRRVSQAAI